MKYADYVILFAALLVAFLLPPYIGQSITQAAADRQTQYAQYLTNACMAAAGDSDLTDGTAFASKKERETAITNFYDTLSLNFSAKNTSLEKEIPYYVPAIVMIDNDGFYVAYNEYDGDSYKLSTTALMPYVRSYGDISLRFYLDGQYDVSNTANGEYEHFDNAQKAYEKYPSLGFLNDKQKEVQERGFVVTDTIKKQTEYYINYHNTYNKLYQASYTFSLPKIAGEDWANLVTGPGVLSFLQGIKAPHGKGYVNIYALAGSRITKSELYYLSGQAGDMSYHKKDCPLCPDAPKRVFQTMEQAAASGAWPCQECVLGGS